MKQRLIHNKALCLAAVGLVGLLSGGPAKSADSPPPEPMKNQIILENEFLKVGIDPDCGAKIRSLIWKATGTQLSEEFTSGHGIAGGLAEDRFAGQGYPGEVATAVFESDTVAPGEKVVFTRVAREEKNVGLEFRKTFVLKPGALNIDVQWEVINRSGEARQITPWVHNIVQRHISQTVLPTAEGVQNIGPGADYFKRPYAGWIGAWEPGGVLIGFVADYDRTMRQYYCYWSGYHTLEWAYFPADIPVGGKWSSVYSIVVIGKVDQLPTLISREGAVAGRMLEGGKQELTFYPSQPGLLNWKVAGEAKEGISLTPGTPVSLSFSEESLPRKEGEATLELTPQGESARTYRVPLEKGTSPDRIAIHPEKQKVSPFHDRPAKQARMKELAAGEGGAKVWSGPVAQRIFPQDGMVADPSLPTPGVQPGGLFQMNLTLDAGEGGETGTVVLPEDRDGLFVPGSLRLYEYGHVELEIPSGFRAEYGIGTYPDPLFPNASPRPNPAPGRRSYVITGRVARSASAGEHRVKLEWKRAGGRQEVEIPLAVRGSALPETPRLRSALGVWSLKPELLQAVGYEEDAKKFQALCFDLLRAARMTPRESGVDWNEKDEEKLGANLRDWMKPPFNTLTVPKPVWSNPNRLAVAYPLLRKESLLDAAFIYMIDEPPQDKWPEMIETARQLESVAPGLRRMATIYDPDPSPLFGAVDIWCRTHQAEPWQEERRAAGDRFWSVNISPIQMEVDLYRLGLTFWKMKLARFDGCLYWNIIGGYGSDNPWTDISCAGTNGGAHLLYPTAQGPIPSVRWLVMAQGVDDYDLLCQLEETGSAEAKAFLEALPKAVEAVSSAAELDTLRARAQDLVNTRSR
ncbi:MAG TPA: glycoside hydrolase domain-containing protein [Chthoniobacteraceae bacterium]|nr:glycoside hydrolase domain-containing protein [Chthoniobacteraceae bacterium]